MDIRNDATTRLPNGDYFFFWEKEPIITRELHVNCAAPNASDANDGSEAAPFKTINAAAAIADAGTRVLIHSGIYRECVRPIKGGTDPGHLVIYEAAGDGEVIISASEIVTEFRRSEDYSIGLSQDGKEPVIWECDFAEDLFRGYNPFGVISALHERACLSATDLTNYLMRRGMIFVDGQPMVQRANYREMAMADNTYWVEEDGMSVHFRLKNDDDPKNHHIEVTTREQCFVPKTQFLAYIKVKGLTFAHAANGGPVPQHGALSANRGHHFIVEDCVVDWANGLGFDFGNVAFGYKRLPGQIIGHAVIRRCRLYNCGVCGITGSGVKNMLIEDNLIQGTGWQHMEESWEAGALKFHECQNTLFRRNIFRDCFCCAGVWLDCGNNNDRFTQNLFLNIRSPHGMIYMECNRGGENLIDNNIFWKSTYYIPPKESKDLMAIALDTSLWDVTFDPDGLSSTKHEVFAEGIHGDGTDDLHIANNFIGQMDRVGYSQTVVQFRMSEGRGGTSRNSIVKNNVFYDCRKAAMRLPNRDNQIDGNYYAKMPQGFLRIFYPAPSTALDLAAWQRFEKYDLNGGYAAFKAEVDEEALTMTFTPEKPRGLFTDSFFMMTWDDSIPIGYAQMKKVAQDPAVNTNFFGEVVEGDRIPGPFTNVADEFTISIDPRKL